MPAEFIEELDSLYIELENRSREQKIDREAQAIVDTYGMMGFIENNGLHQFWSVVEDEDHASRIIDSFRIVGANEISSRLEQLSWVLEVMRRGTDHHGHYRFTKEEEANLDEAEDFICKTFIGFPTKLWDFSKELENRKRA